MTKIKDLKEKMRLQQHMLVKEIKNGTTSKGSPYLTITVQDNSGTIEGKYWDVKKEDQDLLKVGGIYLFSFDVLLYNGNLQLRFSGVKAADETAYDLNEFVIASDVTEKERRKEVEDLINSIQNPIFKQLVVGMLKKAGDKYYSYPAAAKIHHNFLGGLSEHSVSMAHMCEDVCKHYPQLDRDLLISGALVHDIGKTTEMSGPITTEYTIEGKLEGHISLANGWLSEVEEELGLQGKEETVLLHHMILSHHGHYEFGSPVLPMLMEAEVLSLIDNLDARMNTLKQALDGVKPGNFTGRMFALENRQFYKPKYSNKGE